MKKTIIDYLERLELQDNSIEARKVKMKAVRYVMISGELYQQLFFKPYQKSLSGEECVILRKVHEGDYGNHAVGRSMAQKVLHLGYY